MRGIWHSQNVEETSKKKRHVSLENGEMKPRSTFRDVGGCWAKECKLILEGYELNSAKFTPDGSKAWKFEQIFVDFFESWFSGGLEHQLLWIPFGDRTLCLVVSCCI